MIILVTWNNIFNIFRDDYNERDQYPAQRPGQGYNYRGDDKPDRDRSSQYNWEPIPRPGPVHHHTRGDDARSPRYNYRR